MSQPSILKKSIHFLFVLVKIRSGSWTPHAIKTERLQQKLGLFQIRWTDFWILDIKSF